jgi:hypothetical protein
MLFGRRKTANIDHLYLHGPKFNLRLFVWRSISEMDQETQLETQLFF